MRVVIVTGISGAGKSQALNIMEDMGYYCIDNLPPSLIGTIVELCEKNEVIKGKDIALGVDVRGGDYIINLGEVVSRLKSQGYWCEIMFLDAEDPVLIRRYKETRRTHPLDRGGLIQDALNRERELMNNIKESANMYIDTSSFSLPMLKKRIQDIIGDRKENNGFPINIITFGYKYGLPADADLVFDVRFIENPYYNDDLRNLTGRNRKVRDYILRFEKTMKFNKQLYDMLDFLIPEYINEGKGQLTIAIGCTGGKHRSVAIAEMLREHLAQNGYLVHLNHINIEGGETCN